LKGNKRKPDVILGRDRFLSVAAPKPEELVDSNNEAAVKIPEVSFGACPYLLIIHQRFVKNEDLSPLVCPRWFLYGCLVK
jgi:hypothetical protein